MSHKIAGVVRMLEYPKRPRFFAFRFCREMIDQSLALEIGSDACYLLMTIAICEDAKGYRGPVTWYNEPLAATLGCGSVDSLDRIRKRAVSSGWLHYVRGGKSKAGMYWVIIPPHSCGNKSSTVGNIIRIHAEECAEISAESTAEISAEISAEHSSLSLDPFPDPCPSGVSPLKPRRQRTSRSHSESNGYCGAFEAFWAAYPRREGKRKAFEAWKAAGKRVKESKGLSSIESAAHLLERAEAYRDSARGNWPLDKIPHPTTWLNQDRFEDDPASWEAEYNADRPTKPQGEFGRNQSVVESLMDFYADKEEVFDGSAN